MDKFYLSRERHNELVKELEELKTNVRRNITGRLKYAKELGDLSENSEYHDARNEQDKLEQKINHLEEILRNSEIIKKPKNQEVVSIGSHVKIKKGASISDYKIVGSHESDPEKGLISNESPIGKNLLGKGVGDKIKIITPKGEKVYQIVSIE